MTDLVVIASGTSSVDIKLIDEPVAVISISSPAVPTASISMSLSWSESDARSFFFSWYSHK